jgi:hypothetical protein
MSGNFCLNAEFHVTFRDLLHSVKLRHGTDGFTSPPKEGVLMIFFALKIRRLRPGVNQRTCVPKASTLPLDNRSHLAEFWTGASPENQKNNNFYLNTILSAANTKQLEAQDYF